MFLFFSVSPDDYTALESLLRFPSCEVQCCVDIEISNDNVILEQPKSFYVNLRKSKGLGNEVHLSPDEAEISIVDDDGRCTS